jgi:hypothetical protein
MFHLKLAGLQGEIKKGFLITRAQNIFTSISFPPSSVSVHLVYQNLNETNPFLISPCKLAGLSGTPFSSFSFTTQVLRQRFWTAP